MAEGASGKKRPTEQNKVYGDNKRVWEGLQDNACVTELHTLFKTEFSGEKFPHFRIFTNRCKAQKPS